MAQTVKQQQNLPTISEVLMSKGAFVEHGDTHHNVDDDFPALMNSNGRFNLRELYQWMETDLPDRLKDELSKHSPSEKRVAYLRQQIAQLKN